MFFLSEKQVQEEMAHTCKYYVYSSLCRIRQFAAPIYQKN